MADSLLRPFLFSWAAVCGTLLQPPTTGGFDDIVDDIEALHPWRHSARGLETRPLAETLGFMPVLRLTLWSRPRPA